MVLITVYEIIVVECKLRQPTFQLMISEEYFPNKK